MIYRYMCSINMTKAYSLRLLLYSLFSITPATALHFYEIHSFFILSFTAYAFVHHFAVSLEAYTLKNDYKKKGYSAEQSIKEAGAELCLINTGNQASRKIFICSLFLQIIFCLYLVTGYSSYTGVLSSSLIFTHTLFLLLDYFKCKAVIGGLNV